MWLLKKFLKRLASRKKAFFEKNHSSGENGEAVVSSASSEKNGKNQRY